MRRGILPTAIVGLGLAVFLAAPLVVTSVVALHIFVLIFYFAFLASAWNLVALAGQLSLGHSAFLGIGAYTSTLLFMELGVSPWIGMWAGAGLATVVGVLVGLPAFRLRGPYFALTTIAFTEILRIYVENTETAPFGVPLRAAMGLLIPLRGDAPALFQFSGKVPYYYVALAMMCGAVGVAQAVSRTRLGYYLAAIRGDRDAAESLGVNITRYNMIAMALSCFLTALGGTFYAQYFRYVNPTRLLGVDLAIEIALVGLIGGWQTVMGPVIGAIVLSPTSEIIRGQFGGTYAGLHLFLYGLVLMLVILFLPKGLHAPLTALVRKLEGRAVPVRGEGLSVATPDAAPRTEVDAVPRPSGDAPLLEVRGLGKTFGGLVAVQRLDLAVREGEILGLIGPNGAGKTTVFNMVSCAFGPDTGEVFFRGRSLVGLGPSQACALGIARTFQVTRPFEESSVLDNVMVGAFCRTRDRREARRLALDVLETVEFAHRRDVVGHELTVSERKRVEVARALATRPSLLLLDEPMAGLNATEKAHLLALLRQIRDRQGLGIVLVEHDMKAVMSLCERIALMHRGEKLLEGKPAEVARDPRAIAAYLGEDYAIA
jgi:branched-chain amino acid transport system ATP-binding protein/branched-chain amino acid transport system permease protein